LIFTARCYAERGYDTASCLSVRLFVCPSVMLRHDDHIGWNTAKIISPQISLCSSLTKRLDWIGLIDCRLQHHESTPEETPRNFSRIKIGVWKVAFGVQSP